MNLFEIILNFIFNPWFVVSLIFWGIVLFFVFLLRNKKQAYDLFFPLLILFRTKRLNNFIRKVGKKAPRFWRIFWTIGIYVSFGLMIFSFWFFFSNLISLIFKPTILNAITPLIPGVTLQLPLFAFLILPLLLVVTTHEFAHGISATADGVDIKSTGVMGVGVFYLIGFGAFVEVDERSLSSTKFKRSTRLRIAGAGTYVNAVTAGIAFLFLLSFPYINSFFYAQVPQIAQVSTQAEGGYNYGNVTVNDAIIAIKEPATSDKYVNLDEFHGITLSSILDNKSSAFNCSVGDILTLKVYNPDSNTIKEKNITLGARYNLGLEYEKINNTAILLTYNDTSATEIHIPITEINGTQINYAAGITLERFLTVSNLKFLNLTSTTGKSYLVRIKTEGVFIGILSTSYYMYKNDFGRILTNNFPIFILRELIWLFIIAFSIMLFNVLPIPVFDGDRMVKEVLDRLIGERYSSVKVKKDKFPFDKDDTEYGLTEYRVEEIESVKIFMKNKETKGEDEIILDEKTYTLEDTIGDGFKSTLKVNLSEKANIKKNSVVEITYKYSHYD
ncbi:MAG: site-2 protease family protein [Candidatus Lokiarchaeota archaeon]